MKNIHVLSTDKPSRLSIIDSQLIYSKEYFINAQNIYITSDEDINENDYIITKYGRLVQVSYLLSKELEGASKVVLTTDQDLIVDGVQAIDDEFLEWFVKNPSCEEVDVEKHWEIDNWYRIIIPKEEPINICIQTGLPCGMQCLSEEACNTIKPKQETLEEVAETISQKIRFQMDIISDDFENGVQTSMKVFYKVLEDLLFYAEKEEALKQKQDKKMYSEEDMKLAFETGRNFQLTGENNFNELIE